MAPKLLWRLKSRVYGKMGTAITTSRLIGLGTNKVCPANSCSTVSDYVVQLISGAFEHSMYIHVFA